MRDDYADKSWLREDRDSFSLMEPQTAGALLFFALGAALILERMGLL